MTDLRDVKIEVGQQVYFIQLTRGSFRRRSGVVVEFTPTMVRIMADPYYSGGRAELTLKLPEYIIVR